MKSMMHAARNAHALAPNRSADDNAIGESSSVIESRVINLFRPERRSSRGSITLPKSKTASFVPPEPYRPRPSYDFKDVPRWVWIIVNIFLIAVGFLGIYLSR